MELEQFIETMGQLLFIHIWTLIQKRLILPLMKA